jgi:hypothetical protein
MTSLVCDYCGSADLRPLNEAERQSLPDAWADDTHHCNNCDLTTTAAIPKERD